MIDGQDWDNEKSDKSSNQVNSDSDIEYWTGSYIFENEWQSFRIKKTPTLEFASIAHEYRVAGKSRSKKSAHVGQ